MCPDLCKLTPIRRQKGSMLVIAVFIMVVMGFLVLSLSRLLSGSAQAVVIEVLGTRAFLTAQSGMELGVQQLFPVGATGVCAATVSYDFEQISGLSGCEAVVQCTQSLNPGYPVTHYKLQSTGRCGAEETKSSRTLEMELWQ